MAVAGRLVLDDRVAAGRITIEDGLIADVELDAGSRRVGRRAGSSPRASSTSTSTAGAATTRWVAATALDGMARQLLRHGVTSFLPTAVTAPLAAPRRVRRSGPALAAGRARRRRRAARVQPRGPVPRLAPARGAQPGLPPGPRRRATRRRSSRSLDGLRLIDDRPGAAGRARADPLAPRARRGDVARPLGGDRRRGGRAGYAAGGTSTTHLFNAMTGVDHRAAGRRRGRAARRRRLRRADRRRHPRPSGAVAAHRAAEAGRPAAARQRRHRARRHGRRAWPGRRSERRGRRTARHARRDDDPGRIGHRPRRGGAQPRRVGRAAAPTPSPRPAGTRWRCSGSPIAAGSRRDSGPTWSSSTTTCGSAG